MSLSHNIIHRAEDLITYSDKVYPVIDHLEDGQTRARRIIRIGVQVIAHTAREQSLDQTGTLIRSLLHHELTDGGLTAEDTAAWPAYAALTNLPRFTYDMRQLDEPLDTFSQRYADTTRRTTDRAGGFETDSSHAVHLATYALVYAAQFYPDLNPNKIAIYSLLHDAPEAYAGDTPTLGASKKELHEKELKELKARERIKRNFSGPFPQLVDIIEAYEGLGDDESRFVKTADKLDPKFTYGYSNGIALTRDYGYTSSQFNSITSKQRTKLRKSYGKPYSDLIQIHCALSRRYGDAIPWKDKTPA